MQRNKGFIYIMRKENALRGTYKIGKTTNIAKTRRTYERMGNIKMIHYKIIHFLDYIETLILNIVGPYRNKKNNSSHLLEEVNMNIDMLKYIVGWCIKRTLTYGIETDIKRSCSINTIDTHRNNIPISIWDELCQHIIYSFSIDYPVPMDIDNTDSNVYMNIQDFDNIISLYKKSY